MFTFEPKFGKIFFLNLPYTNHKAKLQRYSKFFSVMYFVSHKLKILLDGHEYVFDFLCLGFTTYLPALKDPPSGLGYFSLCWGMNSTKRRCSFF